MMKIVSLVTLCLFVLSACGGAQSAPLPTQASLPDTASNTASSATDGGAQDLTLAQTIVSETGVTY